MNRAIVVGVVVALGVQVVGMAGAGAGSGRDQLADLPASNPARGVVTAGLTVAQDGPCEGLLEVVVEVPVAACTHGPDPAPVALGDVRTEDWSQTEAEQVASTAPPFTCDGDGASGRRAHAIYAVAPDRTDRFATYEAAFKGRIAQIQDEIRQSSLAHGASEPLVYRFTHTTPVDGACEPLVDHVVLPSTADDDSFSATITALQELGYTDPSRRYLVWVDANVLCGIATMYLDDDPSPATNANNVLNKALFSRVDAGCWGYAETHELIHNIGGVQLTAPNSTGAGHCNDDHDLMCYADGGPLSALTVRAECSDKAVWERLLDCGGDDYFNPAPPSGSYLAAHWNTADSGWLLREAAPATDGSTSTEGSTDGGGSTTPVSDSDSPKAFHLTDELRGGPADVSFNYGRATDAVLVGDWDADGDDTIGVRRGAWYHLTNSSTADTTDVSFRYGLQDDESFVGDWNGDGIDTLAVRRGRTFYVTNALTGGPAESVFVYGRHGDEVLVGDWNGDGRDTFTVRRGRTYYVNNRLTGGVADTTFVYGRKGDLVYVGDWDADGSDTFGVRRGKTYYLNNKLTGGVADIEFSYGRSSDETFVGDWNGDKGDTLGIRRAL